VTQLGIYNTNPIVYMQIVLNAELAKYSVILPCSLHISKFLHLLYIIFGWRYSLNSYLGYNLRNLRKIIPYQFNIQCRHTSKLAKTIYLRSSQE